MLEKPGHRVTTTADVGVAFTEAARGAVDLVLLSAAMPGIDSFKFLRKLKERPATTEIPVVMINDRDAMSSVVAMACGLGASDCVEQPFDAYDVTFRVNRAIEYAALKDRWWAPSLATAVAA